MQLRRLNLSVLVPPKVRAYLFLLPITIIGFVIFEVRRQNQTPVAYQTDGRLVISGRFNISDGSPVSNDFMSALGTQIEIMQSEELRERAMMKLRLEQPKAKIRPDISAILVPRTTIFQLTATSSSPEHIKRYLELAMEEYIAVRREQRLVSSRSVMEQISGEIARLEQMLATQEAELFQFKQRRNIVFWEQQATTAARFLSQLKNREASLRMQLNLVGRLDRGAVKESRQNRISTLETSASGELNNRPMPASPPKGQLALQLSRLRELEVERDTLARVFLPKHPKFQHVETEISKVTRLISLLEKDDETAYRQEVEGMRSELDTIVESMADWETKVLESSQVEAEHQKLQSTLTRTRELYQRMVGSLQNIDFRKGVDDEMIQILKRPGPATEQKADLGASVRRMLGYGIIVGLILIGVIVRLDRRGYTVQEVSEAIGVTVAAEIPMMRRRLKHAVSLLDPHCPSEFVESIRTLRSTLALTSPKVAGQGLVSVVCSSTPAEGKSTISTNLAVSAAEAGLRTLLIDADVRRGQIRQRLELPADSKGLSEYLREGGDWRRFIHQTPNSKLSVIPAGSMNSQTLDDITVKFPTALIDEARAEYDVVVIDSSPIIPVSDTEGFLSHVDLTLFVVRLRTSTLGTAMKAFERIKRGARREPLLIVNCTRPSDNQFDYYNYSSYYGRRS